MPAAGDRARDTLEATTGRPHNELMSRLDPRLLLQGYATGIFPMADSREAAELFWVEPRNRAIIPLDRFHLSRSLRRTLRSGKFDVTRDRAFQAVITACADREETWINDELERAMLALHGSGHAHSLEVWLAGELVGGLYGVKLGRAFFGESMFSRERDASKIALAWLVARLRPGNFTLLDCQFMTEHRLHLVVVEGVHDAARHSDRVLPLVQTGRERVHLGAVVQRDLGHADAGLLRMRAHRVEQPLLGRIARLGDHLRERFLSYGSAGGHPVMAKAVVDLAAWRADHAYHGPNGLEHAIRRELLRALNSSRVSLPSSTPGRRSRRQSRTNSTA